MSDTILWSTQRALATILIASVGAWLVIWAIVAGANWIAMRTMGLW